MSVNQPDEGHQPAKPVIFRIRPSPPAPPQPPAMCVVFQHPSFLSHNCVADISQPRQL